MPKYCCCNWYSGVRYCYTADHQKVLRTKIRSTQVLFAKKKNRDRWEVGFAIPTLQKIMLNLNFHGCVPTYQALLLLRAVALGTHTAGVCDSLHFAPTTCCIVPGRLLIVPYSSSTGTVVGTNCTPINIIVDWVVTGGCFAPTKQTTTAVSPRHPTSQKTNDFIIHMIRR